MEETLAQLPLSAANMEISLQMDRQETQATEDIEQGHPADAVSQILTDQPIQADSQSSSSAAVQQKILTPVSQIIDDEIFDVVSSISKYSANRMAAGATNSWVSSTGGSETISPASLQKDADKGADSPSVVEGHSASTEPQKPPNPHTQLEEAESEDSVKSVHSQLELFSFSKKKDSQNQRQAFKQKQSLDVKPNHQPIKMPNKKRVEMEEILTDPVQVLTDIEDIDDVVEPNALARINCSSKRLVNVANLIDASKRWSKSQSASNPIEVDNRADAGSMMHDRSKSVAKLHPLIKTTAGQKPPSKPHSPTEQEKHLTEVCNNLNDRLVEQQEEINSMAQKVKLLSGEAAKYKHDREAALHELETATKENKGLAIRCKELAEEKCSLIIKYDSLERQFKELSSLLVIAKEQNSVLKYQLSLSDKQKSSSRLMKQEDLQEHEEASTTSNRQINSNTVLRTSGFVFTNSLEGKVFDRRVKIFADNSTEREVNLNKKEPSDLPNGYSWNIPKHRTQQPTRSCLKLPRVGPKGNLITSSPTKSRDSEAKVRFNPELMVVTFEQEESSQELPKDGEQLALEGEILPGVWGDSSTPLPGEFLGLEPTVTFARVHPPTPGKRKKKKLSAQHQAEKEISRVLAQEFGVVAEREGSPDSEEERLEETLQRKESNLGKRKAVR